MSDAPVAASRVSTLDGQLDPYDHEISLVDTTNPDASKSRNGSPARNLKKKPTRISVREQLARRKYARYSYERYSKTGSVVTDDEVEHGEPTETQTDPPNQAEDTEAVDFAARGRTIEQKRREQHTGPASEIDILYENQRGSFFFGIPLYSHSSLLQFDPGPWVNKDFKDSAVDITNAQVPDPTWKWAWKSWYVDMSYDVDEEGWQYPFLFGNFAWHGTHPWFHSFVRRRRWLRKRVKQGHSVVGSGKPGSMGAAHKLNTDYFTIHPKRERSPESRRPESYTSLGTKEEIEGPPEDIQDVGSLMKALRFASVDREKIDLVKKFVKDGGDELAYLKSTIPEIMTFLVFQNSKQQLLSYLKSTANEAKEHRDQHDAEEKPEGGDEKRRIDNLLAAVDACNREIGGLEYWSDRKHVLKTADAESQEMRTISTIFDAPAPKQDIDDNPVERIRGISSKAEVGLDPTHRTIHQDDENEQDQSESQPVNKGKGKGRERENENQRDEEETSPPRLKADQLLIPD